MQNVPGCFKMELDFVIFRAEMLYPNLHKAEQA